MKKALLLSFILTIGCQLYAQITFTKFPTSLSFFACELNHPFALVEISGLLQNASSSDSLFLIKLRNHQIVYKKYLAPKPLHTSYRFQYIDTLNAEFSNTAYELWRGDEALLQKADSVCAGDMFMITGQSNAEAAPHGESSIGMLHPFIRTYGCASEKAYQKRWYIASGDGNRDTNGHIGQLGIALAYQLLNELQIPICIMNGAVGGKTIQYFLPNHQNHILASTNYGRLLQRFTELEMTNKVKAIIWFQGEQDAANKTTASNYYDAMHELYNSWQDDYPGFEHLYMYQIRNGCKLDIRDIGTIQQAQYNFALQHNQVTLFSSNLAKQSQDDCHFTFHEGYLKLSKPLFDAIRSSYHEHEDKEIFKSILLKQIEKISLHEIAIHFSNSANYWIDTLCKNDFYINQNMEHPSEIKILSDGLQLYFTNPIPDNYKISYAGHSGEIFPCISNQYENGLLCFYNLGDTIFYDEQMPFQEPQTSINAFNIYTSDFKLIVESSKQSTLEIEFTLYDIAGITHNYVQGFVYTGRNEFPLETNANAYYILDVKIKDGNYTTQKKLKLIK